MPRDLRWFLGGLGKVLISTGLLIFAFVAYQLWGTGIQYARAQDKLASQFETQLAAVPGAAPLLETTTSATPDDGSLPPIETTTTSDAATVTTAAPTTAPTAAAPINIGLGQVLGVIEIPTIGVKDYIVAGVGASELEKGVGHYPYTPLPGQTGNVAIAGHRTTHGQPFFRLDELQPGDEIVITTFQGKFTYSVTGTKVVPPTDFTVLYGDPSRSELTLTTCHPRFSQKERLIVSAVFVPEESTQTDAQIVYDASSTGQETGPDSTLPGFEDGSVPAVDQNGEAIDTPAATGGTSVDGATQDAFSQGWFSDPDAWPHIALWGLALVAWSLLMTWFGKRTRVWLSAIAWIAPFTFVLYFWFENVNRLLPPNL
ncbi:MAG: class E sortase [Ilumatobacteraceae bacterium]